MFRNVIYKNDHLFKRILAEVKDWNNYSVLCKTRFCYPILINADQRLACQSTSLCYNNKQTFLPQADVRCKSTVVKEKNVESKDTRPVDTDIKDLKAPMLTRAQKLKKAVTEYGSTVIVFHVGISLVSLGTCYLLVSSGLDVAKIFTWLGLQEWFSNSQIAASAGTFAVAYAVHKVFAPVRITITLASVPLIVRYLRRIGFLKKS